MSGMPLVTKVALWVGSFCVGSFVAGMVVIMEALAALRKGPSAVFYMKKRPAPPACMQDPNLGVHGYAHLEDVRLHYVSAGSEDKPLMLLVHGFPEFWYSWRHQLREFKDSYRVVAIDQRGYGDSDKPSSVSDYSLQALTNDLRQLVTALGYKKCVLVGHDWGGIVAWSFAQTSPEMVERFIVMNCPSSAAYIKQASSGFSQIRKSWYISFFQVPYIPELNLQMSDLDNLRNAFKGEAFGLKSGNMSDDDVEAYKYTFQKGADHVGGQLRRDKECPFTGVTKSGRVWRKVPESDAWSVLPTIRGNGFTGPMNYYRALVRYPDLFFHRLPAPDLKVKCPTLIVWGCQDTAFDIELAALSSESVEGEVSVKYIEDSSHWTQMDQYSEVNAYMREFLDTTHKKSL